MGAFKFILIMVFFISQANSVFAQQRREFFSTTGKVSIEPAKETFEVGETLEGKIKIENMYANGIPSVFIIRIFHEHKEVNRLTTSIPHVPFGEMTTSFKSFGIPAFNLDPSSIGTWRIVIFLQNTDESKAPSATIKIVAASKERF